jgi:hypothetical protein
MARIHLQGYHSGHWVLVKRTGKAKDSREPAAANFLAEQNDEESLSCVSIFSWATT